MATNRDAEDPVADLRVELGIVSGRTDRLETITDQLIRDQADTRAAVDALRAAIIASENRVIRTIESGDTRLEARLEAQDQDAAEIKSAASEAKEAASEARAAAFVAKTISENALVEARREWPRVAKVAVTLLSAAIAAAVGFLLRHLVGG